MSYTSIINKCKKDWNCPELMEGAHAARGAKIPFSSPLMNWCTYGGIPRNKITEFYGEPGAGKSTSCIDICKNAVDIFHKEYEDEIEKLTAKAASGDKTAKVSLMDLQEAGPQKVLYIDLEHSFDDAWSQVLGINQEDIEIMQPPNIPAEDILNTVLSLVETSEIGMIVLDSIPSLVPRSELEKNLGERTVAALAGLLTVFCRKVVPLLTRHQTTLVCINQVRANMDNPYVVKTPGGEALKFYCSLRILFQFGTPIDFLGNELPKSSENPAGYIINAKITKQKSAPFDRKLGSYFLLCQSGISPLFDFAKLAINKYGIIKKGGAWFTLVNVETGEILEDEEGKPVKINGLAKVYQYLQDNPDYYESVQKYILDDINQTKEDENEVVEDDEVE